MSAFTDSELAFLTDQRLGRLATIGPDGAPQNRPVGFSVDPATGTIDIIGHDNPATQKWRNIQRNSHVSFVVDDVVLDPWSPRAVEIRGVAELLPDATDPRSPWAKPGVIRIHPRRVLALGLADEAGARTV